MSNTRNPKMVDELAAVFDLLKVKLDKADQKHEKAEALGSLVQGAVQRAIQAGELAGEPTAMTTIVLVALRYMAGTLLVHGEQSTPSGLVLRPHQSISKKFSAMKSVNNQSNAESAPSQVHPSAGASSSQRTPGSTAPDEARLIVINDALAALGIAAVKTRSDVAKMPASHVRQLCLHLQEHVDHDAGTGKDIDFMRDYVAGPDGIFKHSASGNATAADFRDALRKWLSGV